jgi:hypothetical protein
MSDQLWEERPEVKFRPSYSATTLNCVGSLLPSLAQPDSAGYEAAVGTVFHQLIAKWQLTSEPPLEMLDTVITVDRYDVTVDQEMFTFGGEALRQYNDIHGNRYVETVVDISSLTPIPEQTGTSDLIIVSPGVIDVIDWKYGKGIKVFAKDNTQLLCYAWGAFERFDLTYGIETIRLHIAQPRLDHYDVWEIDRAKLLEFAAWARSQWFRAWRGDAPRYPSPKACQWCRVRVTCPARQAMLERLADDTFRAEITPEEQRALTDPEVTLTSPLELSTERLARIYQYRRSIEVWLREIGDELIRRGLAGEDLVVWKVVEGRLGNRQWHDEPTAGAALERLGIDPWSHDLLSPAQVEKRLRDIGITATMSRRYLGIYTERSAGKPTLVSVGDDRLALDEVAELTFNPESSDV